MWFPRHAIALATLAASSPVLSSAFFASPARPIATSTVALSASGRSTAFLKNTASRSVKGVLPTSRSSFATNNDLRLNPAGVITSSPYGRTGAHNMVLSNLFGGGSYNLQVDYSTLDFPGNELGQMALDGKVVVYSEREPHLRAATFAGGCFWGMELAFQRVPGVVYTATGYTQGVEERPTYDQVCSGNTGHTEAVMVYYDPKECKYDDLLDTFFERVDPTTVNGQGNDRGRQYRTGVYFHTDEQEAIARMRFLKEQEHRTRVIASELNAATPFWPAEKYHQQYLEKGGRSGTPQSTEKESKETIRCYG